MRRSPLARPLTAVIAAVLVAGALAGCSGLSTDGGGCIAPGDASTTIDVSGAVGSAPAVEFPTPLIATEPQLTVLTQGEGETASRYDAVAVDLTIFDGSTGEAQQASPYTGTSTAAFYAAGDGVGALGDALLCVSPGERFVLVAPVESFNSEFDPDETELSGVTAVVVVDVLDILPGKANGINQLPEDGMPTVVTAVDGTPGIAVAYSAVPDADRAATIKRGAGDVVADGDEIVLHLRSWTWTEDSVAIGQGDTWATKSPTVQTVGDDAQLPAAAWDALIGEKVGSQVLVVIPAGDGTATIFVFDILGVFPQD